MKVDPEGGTPIRTTVKQEKKKKEPWECQNRFPLTCIKHGEQISVPCGRWKTCHACRITKSWELRSRFINGIQEVPNGKLPMFVTLTFPEDRAPDEDQAHLALRSLVARLRYRDYLGAYGWVLQRQKNDSLHYHGIFHLPWFTDDLKEWRDLAVVSKFGPQQNIKIANVKHATYLSRYISNRLAKLSPVRRAFSFSQDFPPSNYQLRKLELAKNKVLLKQIGVQFCDWESAAAVEAFFRK